MSESARVCLSCTSTRTIAVDRFNDIWVGGLDDPRTHLKISALTAAPVPGSAFSPAVGGYGGVIDSAGALWSSSRGRPLLRLVPPSSFPVQSNDWQALVTGDSDADREAYGIAPDPLHPYIWQTSAGYVFRWHTNGTPEVDNNANLILYPHQGGTSQGLAVDTDGHVWVAHGKGGSSTVGHLNTNGTLIGLVDLRVMGLFAEYFANTNLDGWPLLTNLKTGPVDYTPTNWPASPLPTNEFSVRWSGVVQPLAQGDHIFYVSADAGAAFRLTLNGATIIDNWASPAANAVELLGTNWLGTNLYYGLRLEYAHLTNEASIRLSWMKAGTTNEEVIPQGRFGPFVRPGSIYLSDGPTGVSVDPAGKIWAACYNSDSATRIDPNAGPLVVADGQTNHVGLVDMAVDLGDGSWHPAPYNKPASPYNYSDMTGFNNRVVNPGLKPLKGYWIAIDDSGNTGQLWNRVSWTAGQTNGCSIEVYVRASDDRTGLGSEIFVPVTNNVAFPAIRGRYIEVRLAVTRDDASRVPVLYDLTLYGVSSGFKGDYFLYGATAEEGGDAEFWTDLVGAEPMTYEWFIQYPWETDLVAVPGATNSYFSVTNVDSWVAGTMASLLVTNGSGEALWLGPAELLVYAVRIDIPPTNYVSKLGPASRYPAVINVFGQPTSFNRVSVTVTLWGLTHQRSADLSILLVSPLGTNIMLMSNVGGTNGVLAADISFQQGWSPPTQPDRISSGGPWPYGPSNYGGETQMPQVGADPPPAHTGFYSINLDDLQHDDPNGRWRLYIYDRYQAMAGELTGSWQLGFKFQ